jgi:histidyl-tRNA synthetase
MAQKPSIPKGTRDFSPEEVAKRNYIFDTIKVSFENFGFQPIETPSFENSETLMGKYGDEGDRLIFKILNSGDFLGKADENLLSQKESLKITSQISEKALRYDLTVPFARYVVQHQNEIDFPFKRYQMQPVWRADRPQKGRFREFYQCDADVVGSNSLWQEVEFVQLYDDVFTKLGLTKVTIKLNNRKILSGIAEMIGAKDKLIDFTVALDKLDKIGEQGVIDEMLSKGIAESAIEKVKPLFRLSGSNTEKLEQLKGMLQISDQGKQGVEELEFVIQTVEELGLQSAKVQIDVTLARGLNYYTGAIFEVAADNVKMGSIGGGGRYDDLTGIFGLKDLGGIGISFGLDRIYLVLEELSLFKKVTLPKPVVLFLNFGEKEALYCLKAIKKLREHNIKCELYPDNAKLKKQMNYADKRQIPYVVFVGESELQKNNFTVKEMVSGNQKECNFEELLAIVNTI